MTSTYPLLCRGVWTFSTSIGRFVSIGTTGRSARWRARTPRPFPFRMALPMNYSLSHILGLVLCLCIGMVMFPLVVQYADGSMIPVHAKTILTIGGAFVGVGIYAGMLLGINRSRRRTPSE